ncbi:hypothetical protein VP01_567g11 [Puccinia sorghi]|uniref:Integrase catalytic domain-containing protein n=1 Tax=Puccinia sorghi TaxID=27349 RepID=A0A0L6UJI9_9BASI|nr:hypothetical protein VP01_567g11 [Puccinia sorghi]
MDKLKLIYLKLAINAVPTLTQDNYSIWHTRILKYFDILKIKDYFLEEKGALSNDQARNVRTILTAKIDAVVHANVINHLNKDNVLLIWKAIINYFASQHAANCARVWNHFSYLSFNQADISGFITNVKSVIEKLHEVGINHDLDIIAYEIIKKLPKTPEFNGIATAITHSGSAITPELVLDHLRLHANQLAIEGPTGSSSINQVSLFTDSSQKCRSDAHNTLANHPPSRCWKMFPHLRPASNPSKGKDSHLEHSVSSFFSSQPPLLPCFILDSGATAHMTANLNLFTSFNHSEEGIVQTSSGVESMRIEGSGSIKLEFGTGSLVLDDVLYVPKLAVNLLSIRCLVLNDYVVSFEKNSFTVSNSTGTIIAGNYVSNLPTVEFKNLIHQSLFSPSELLHKSLGHVSYHRIRRRLGIPVKDFGSCEACAVSKITHGSFHTRHSRATKPFEELHIDLVGPILPISREGFKYFLTIVDSCTWYCSAIPVKDKSNVAEMIAQAIGLKAKHFGYFPSVIHSDRGTEFINSHLLEF